MKLSLPNDEWVSIGKGALIAGVGAVLTYLLQAMSSADFGALTPAIVAILSVLVNYFRKIAMP